MSATIREIRRLYPEAYIVLVIHKRSVTLAEHCPYVNEIIINDMHLNNSNLDKVYISCLEFSQKLLKFQFDIAYAFVFGITPYNQLLAYMSGARERISLVYNENTKLFAPLLTMALPFPMNATHAADICLSYLERQLLAPISNRRLEVWFGPRDISEMKDLLPDGNIYAISIGGSQRKKHWAPEYYAELINMIAKTDSVKFVILGGTGDVDASRIIETSTNSKIIINLAGKLNYRQSIAVISLCKIYIGNDTGTMHAAAALDIPVLAPFCFPADLKLPEEVAPLSTLNRWYPYEVPSVVVQPKHALLECKNSTDVSGCQIDNEAHCINQITPKTMFKAFKLLKQQITKQVTEPVYFS